MSEQESNTLSIDDSGLETEVGEVVNTSDQLPFDPTKIDLFTKTHTIDALLSRLKYGELDLLPDFQRKANLWNETDKTALIESLLLRIPIPSLYVSEDEAGHYAVVDGLQRMSAIAHFVDVNSLNQVLDTNLHPLKLNIKGLNYLQDLEGKTFDELERPLQRRIIETELILHVIRSGTPGLVKFNIFSRINQGGLPLTAQEIRNAIYPGRWYEEIHALVDSVEFQEATEGKINAKRMEDMELMLRAVALYHYNESRPNEQNLVDYLNDFVEKECQHWDQEKWANVAHQIKQALRTAPKVFGEYVFRKWYGESSRRQPINRGLFDSQVGILARLNAKKRSQLIGHKEIILEQYTLLMSFHFEGVSDEFERIAADFNTAMTSATGKGWASNKRVEAMQYIFDQALKSNEGNSNA